MRELKRQGNAIEARQATAVATLVTITKESPRATGRQTWRQDRATRFRQIVDKIPTEIGDYDNYNKGKPEGDRP
jgi:hypothetical protein